MINYSDLWNKPDIDDITAVEKWLSKILGFIGPRMHQFTAITYSYSNDPLRTAVSSGDPVIEFMFQNSDHILRMCNLLTEIDPVIYRQKYFMTKLPILVYDFKQLVTPELIDGTIRKHRCKLEKIYPEYYDALFTDSDKK